MHDVKVWSLCSDESNSPKVPFFIDAPNLLCAIKQFKIFVRNQPIFHKDNNQPKTSISHHRIFTEKGNRPRITEDFTEPQ
jgi:hypothetical protein